MKYIFYQKIFFVLVILAIKNPLLAKESDECQSGRVRISAIMQDSQTGIDACNKKNITYAETANLAQDLNTDKIAEFFDCKTLIGKDFFSESLKSPISPENKNIILNRQHAIRTLVENPALKQEFEALLWEAKEQEEEIALLFSDFFMGKNCPELKVLATLKEQNPLLYPPIAFLHLNPTGKIVQNLMNLASLAGLSWSTYYFGKQTYLLAKNGYNYANLALYTAYLGLLVGFTGYQVSKDYILGSEKRLKLHAFNRMIVIAEQLEALCKKSTIVKQYNLKDTSTAEELDLIKDLKHSRYQSKNTLFFNSPSVHTFLYKVYQQQKHLRHIFSAIAEMDAYNAIATKIIESKNERNTFCFATFINIPKSHIKATSFWNILVTNAITNTIDEQRNIILTGPNAGGKTTAIRALLQNIVLGQTFGIAAAEVFEYTMFDSIHSYLNISDDITKGLSLFASEVKRAQGILETIKSLESGKKFFFALDELFTGTVAEDGETCAYEFVKKIKMFPSVQFIYATHFAKLKEQGEENSICTNYKVDAPKISEGKIVYPFTISKGFSDARVALDIAKQANLFS